MTDDELKRESLNEVCQMLMERVKAVPDNDEERTIGLLYVRQLLRMELAKMDLPDGGASWPKV